MTTKWYNVVSRNLDKLPECIEYYDTELDGAKRDLSLKGISLERHAAMLPGIVEHRFSQLQEIESILEYLNIKYKQQRSTAFKRFTVAYEKALTSRDADKYVDGDDDVVDMAILVNDFALLRNKYLALHKGLELKHWQIANVVKLRCAGLDDITLS